MDCTIKHESLGRLRIHLHQCYMTLPEADQVKYWIKELAGVNRVKVYDRTADATILYDGKTDTRQRIIDCLSSFDYKTCKPKVAEHTGREIQRYYEDKMFDHIAARIITRWFLPVPIRSSIRLIKAVPFVLHGLKSLSKGKLDVHVLDATSVTFALIRQDFDTAGSVMFLLGVGDIMEEWTHRKSVDDLANAMSLHIDKVWRKEKDTDTLIPIMEIKLNDQIFVRTGNMIPLDGLVVSGDAMVNQSSITGEPLSVHKSEGAPIAREVADITIAENDLQALVTLRQLCNALNQRNKHTYDFIMGINSGLIILGMFGILQPSMTALLHNASIIGISLNCMTGLTAKEQQPSLLLS